MRAFFYLCSNMFFKPLRDIANKIINLDPNRVVFEIIQADKALQEDISDLNRENQLFDKGINANGVNLESIGGGYAYLTVQIKRRKNQPIDRITLKDTGDFYDSFKIRASLNYFEIEADPTKDGQSLYDRWGEDILGLTSESKEILATKLIPIIRQKLTNELL